MNQLIEQVFQILNSDPGNDTQETQKNLFLNSVKEKRLFIKEVISTPVFNNRDKVLLTKCYIILRDLINEPKHMEEFIGHFKKHCATEENIRELFKVVDDQNIIESFLEVGSHLYLFKPVVINYLINQDKLLLIALNEKEEDVNRQHAIKKLDYEHFDILCQKLGNENIKKWLNNQREISSTKIDVYLGDKSINAKRNEDSTYIVHEISRFNIDVLKNVAIRSKNGRIRKVATDSIERQMKVAQFEEIRMQAKEALSQIHGGLVPSTRKSKKNEIERNKQHNKWWKFW